MREPTIVELIAFVCSVQPELDEPAATLILVNEELRAWISERFLDHRVLASSLLDLHLSTVAPA